MALMERVATLLRANLNDLVDRAEDPEKMLKQLVLDMENQLLQLKTQVAVALADQHLLEKKAREQESATADWHRKAGLAVSKGDDTLARAALERAITQERTLLAYQGQVTEQAVESEALRGTYARLQGKLAETQAQCEILLAQHRRAQMVSRATAARTAVEEGVPGDRREPIVQRVQARIDGTEAQNHAAKQLLAGGAGESLEDRFRALEQEDRVEQMLAELKSRQNRMLAAG